MHLHAVAVARVAAATAVMLSIPADLPHLAGLLHDCGKLVMPLAFGEPGTDEIAALHPSGAARSAAEWDRFGIDHAYAGALFAEQSGLATELVAAIAWHHGGRHGRVAPTPEIGCLQLANTVVGMLAGELPDEELMAELLASLELSADALDELAEAAGAGPAAPMTPGLGDRVAELERLASTDELTGLANRRHWMAIIRQTMESGAHGTVLLCDLDRFKQVNDTHGHSTGDIVLMEVSRILQHHGIAGRIGGDEFALWVTGDAPMAVAERIVAEVAVAFDSHTELSVGISIGVAPTLRDLSDALEAADRALYKAKSAGRGRAQLYEEPKELVA
jgi:diguanylate cyclase (GGDEF)-like protein/putative nucleotidyltransferase with HDIG domain